MTGARSEKGTGAAVDVVEHGRRGQIMGALIFILNMIKNCHVKILSSSKLLKIPVFPSQICNIFLNYVCCGFWYIFFFAIQLD